MKRMLILMIEMKCEEKIVIKSEMRRGEERRGEGRGGERRGGQRKGAGGMRKESGEEKDEKLLV